MESSENSSARHYTVVGKDVNAVCRSCLASEALVKIFPNDSDQWNVEYAELLRPAYISVAWNDGLPNLICEPCLDVLRTWHCFRTRCDESYKLLERLQECAILDETSADICVDSGLIIEDVKIEEIYVDEEALSSLEQQPMIGLDEEVIEGEGEDPKQEMIQETLETLELVNDEQAEQISRRVRGSEKKRYIYMRQCPICGLVMKRGLKEHIMIHNDPTGRPFKCDQCDKTYCRRENLRQHQQREHLMIRYPCDICGKAFSTRDVLASHRKLHDSNVQYKCDECGQQFKSNKYLYKHKQKHLGIKKFICTFCGKSFLVGEYLKDHLRIHTGEKPFGCKICGKEFRTMNHLRQHNRTHQIHTVDKGVREEYRCTDCNELFSSAKLLDAHKKMHLESSPT